MELQSLNVSTREERGSSNARRGRLAGDVPIVLYGMGGAAISLKVNARALDILLHGDQGEHALIDLKVEDDPDMGGPAMLKEVQHHPIRGQVVHADLLRIDLTHKIQTKVAIRLEGVCPGVIEGGVVDHQTRELDILCLPLEVPDAIVGSLTELNIGDSMHVSDLVAPEGVEILTPGERALVAVHAPRVVLEAEPAEGELLEGEEGAEGEGEEGAEGGDDEKKADE